MKAKVSVSLDEDVLDALDRLCERRGLARSTIIQRALMADETLRKELAEWDFYRNDDD